MGFSEVITYSSAAALSFDTAKVAIVGGALTLLGPTPYTLTNPIVTSQHQNTISGLTSFAESSTKPAGTIIQYQLVLNGAAYWYNAINAKWESSDGTFTQSNTPADINAQATTLFTDLNLITNQFLGLNIFLSTVNTNNRPILATNTIGYSWTNSNASAISNCLVTGYLADLVGGNPVPTSTTPVSLQVSAPYGFFHGNHLVEPFTKTFAFDTNGLVSASIIETATPGVKLKFAIIYYDGQSVKSTQLFNAVVPNQPNVSIQNLSTVVPYDFG